MESKKFFIGKKFVRELNLVSMEWNKIGNDLIEFVNELIEKNVWNDYDKEYLDIVCSGGLDWFIFLTMEKKQPVPLKAFQEWKNGIFERGQVEDWKTRIMGIKKIKMPDENEIFEEETKDASLNERVKTAIQKGTSPTKEEEPAHDVKDEKPFWN